MIPVLHVFMSTLALRGKSGQLEAALPHKKWFRHSACSLASGSQSNSPYVAERIHICVTDRG